MSAHLELLRFNWKPSVIRLALAALADAGPVALKTWVARAGLPANHFAAVLGESERLGLIVVETPAEGIRLLVQPVAYWRERPMLSAEEFARMWEGSMVQCRMALGPGLAEAASRNPVLLPESGGESARIPGQECGFPSSTFRRSDVSEIERTTSKRGDEHGDGLRERVRLFVGERDWRKFWEHDEWQDIFDDVQRAKVLASSLRYLQAGLREGVAFRKNGGAALWADYKRCLGREAAKL